MSELSFKVNFNSSLFLVSRMAADLQNLVYQHKGPAGKVWKAEDAMATTVTWQPDQGRVSFQHSKGRGDTSVGVGGSILCVRRTCMGGSSELEMPSGKEGTD